MEIVVVSVLALQMIGTLTIYGIVTRIEAKASQNHDSMERIERKTEKLLPKVHPSKMPGMLP